MSRKLYTKTGPKAFPGIFVTPVISANSGNTNSHEDDRIHVSRAEVGNSTGSAANCGFGYEIPDAHWKAGIWDNSASASYTDDTTDAQDAGATDFAMTNASEDDDGFVVQSNMKFNVLGMDIGTAGAGGGIASPTYEYWSTSGWKTLPVIESGDFTNNSSFEYVVWLEPLDLDVLASGDTPVDTDGLDSGKYAIRISWGTAPTTAPVADEIWIGQLMDYVEQVEDGKSIRKEFNPDQPLPFKSNLIAYCNVANAANWIDVEYRMGP